MIQLIPSISVLRGQVIRLTRGDYENPVLYKKSPIDLARKFEDHGIEVVHLVDLDGALDGKFKNYHILEALVGHTNLKIDCTGGIYTDGDISKAYEYGASYITAASVSAQNRDLFASWIISYGREKITLGADVRGTKIAVRGWMRDTGIDIFDHIEYFYNHGLKYVKTTDIDKDGCLVGPAFDLYKEIMKRFPNIKVLASGGVRHMDIKALNDMGVFAVIFGKAYYEKRISLKELDRFVAQEA